MSAAIPTGLLVLAAIGLLACGDDAPSKDEYERQVGQALRGVRAGAGAVQEGRLRSKREAAEVLAGVARPMANAADRLETIDPPDEVEAAHRDFIQAIRAFATDSLTAGQAFQRGREKQLERRGGILRPETSARLQRAVAAFREKGYEIGTTLEGQ